MQKMQRSTSSSVDALQGGKKKLYLLMSLSFPFLLADEFNIILFSFNILYTFSLIVDCGLWIKELQIIIKTEIRGQSKKEISFKISALHRIAQWCLGFL
jgi:hypothetical protein